MSLVIRGPFDRVEQTYALRTVRPVGPAGEQSKEKGDQARQEEEIRTVARGPEVKRPRPAAKKKKVREDGARHIDFTA